MMFVFSFVVFFFVFFFLLFSLYFCLMFFVHNRYGSIVIVIGENKNA